MTDDFDHMRWCVLNDGNLEEYLVKDHQLVNLIKINGRPCNVFVADLFRSLIGVRQWMGEQGTVIYAVKVDRANQRKVTRERPVPCRGCAADTFFDDRVCDPCLMEGVRPATGS